jgi:hypothetical protein
VEHLPGSGLPDPDQIAKWQARAEAGDRNAAGRLGELLAERGDLEAAVRVWAQAYGDDEPTTRRLGELLAERGDLEGAVGAWRISGAVWENPASLHAEFLSGLSPDEFLLWDDPEDWCFTGIAEERLAGLLAERGDEAAIAELRARADAGDPAAVKRLAELPTALPAMTETGDRVDGKPR